MPVTPLRQPIRLRSSSPYSSSLDCSAARIGRINAARAGGKSEKRSRLRLRLRRRASASSTGNIIFARTSGRCRRRRRPLESFELDWPREAREA
ncbi:hypothetical protein NL676_031264 [Syzygium grande]|nr:hypothetical protein NL676_031264 [Syzygium grande]